MKALEPRGCRTQRSEVVKGYSTMKKTELEAKVRKPKEQERFADIYSHQSLEIQRFPRWLVLMIKVRSSPHP